MLVHSVFLLYPSLLKVAQHRLNIFFTIGGGGGGGGGSRYKLHGYNKIIRLKLFKCKTQGPFVLAVA